MAKFNYKAVDSRGSRKTGTMEGPTKEYVKNHLGKMRLKVISVEEESTSGVKSFLNGRIKIDAKGNVQVSLSGTGNVSANDLFVFTRQLQTMLNSSIPLNQSLEMLARQQVNIEFGQTIAAIQKSIEEGSKFSEAMARYPRTFDNLYCSLIKAGEESGKIAEILIKLVSYVENSAKLKRQIKSAMMYPLGVMGFSVLVIWALLTFVVPKFAAQFTGSGKQLPWITEKVLFLSNQLRDNGAGLVVTIGIIAFLINKWVSSPAGRRVVHTYALKAPVVGELVRKISIARFCSTMATMLGSGVNIIQALNICASAAGNLVIEEFILYSKSRVEQGELLSAPIKENGLFPPMVVGMIEVGEKAGKLDEMLDKVSDFYDDEVENTIKGMLALIEPTMIVFLGSVIAVLVLAMYLPIMDLGETVG